MAGWFSIAFYFGIAWCCTQAAWNSTEDWIKFLRFSKDFSKVYHSDEELSERFAAFRASLQRHALLNRAYPPGSPVYGVNKFSDLTPAEFKGADPNHNQTESISSFSSPPAQSAICLLWSQMTVHRSTQRCQPRRRMRRWLLIGLSRSHLVCVHPLPPPPPPSAQAPEGQSHPSEEPGEVWFVLVGRCNCKSCLEGEGEGSGAVLFPCRAFSVVETVESRAAILGYPLTSLSTQQLLSCDNDSQFGCEGGLPSYAFSWLKKVGFGRSRGRGRRAEGRGAAHHPSLSAGCRAPNDRAAVPI